MNNSFSSQMLDRLYRFAQNNIKIALVDKNGTRKTSYHDFFQTINSIAYWLRNQGVCRGEVIAIELGRCMEHYAVRLACHFIGAVCLIVNPDTPDLRKKAIYDDTKVGIIISNDMLSDIEISCFKCQIDNKLTDKDLGYIVYTSGSTGMPKGILHDRSLYELYQNCINYINNPAYENQGKKNYQ